MKKNIKIQTLLIFMFMLMSVLLSKVFFPEWKNGALDESLDALGIAFVLFGFLFRICTRSYKISGSSSSRHLVIGGPYSLMRNPMYFGTFLIGLGVIFLLFNWWVFPIFLAGFLLIYIPAVNREEEKLRRQFGEEYINYCRDTPRVFPRISNLLRLNLSDYLPLEWRLIKRELASLVGTLLVITAIEIREDVRLFGRAEYAKEAVELVSAVVPFVGILLLFTNKKIFPKKS